jgi:hypothetical protein
MVLVTATTAAAALRYNTVSNLGAAQTLHRAAQLPMPGRPLVPMRASLSAQESNSLGTAKGAMEATEVLFCDEMSMLTVTLLYVLISSYASGNESAGNEEDFGVSGRSCSITSSVSP